MINMHNIYHSLVLTLKPTSFQEKTIMARVSIMSILMVFAATAMLVDMAVAVDSPGGASGGWDLAANKQGTKKTNVINLYL